MSSEPDAIGAIGIQARELISDDTTWVELARVLDVERYSQRDQYPDWHSSTPFKPLFKAVLWAKTENVPLSTIPQQLSDQPELAEAVGFDVNNLPSASTFKPCRVNKRFSELEQTLSRGAENIQHIAAERGAPIGHPVDMEGYSKAPTSNPSQRSIDRKLRRQGKKVLKEVERTVFPSISLPRPDGAIYDDDELLTLETTAAITNSAANQSGEQLADMKSPDPAPDDPFYKDGPTGETLLTSVKNLSVDEIAEQINHGLQKTYTRARPKLEQLDNFDTDVMVALDVTYIGYWADGNEIEWLQGAPPNKEYDKCFKFATAAIVGQHSHFTVAALPLGSPGYADNDAYPAETDQSYYIGDVTRQLLDIASEHVNIRMVVADREFYSADVVDAIESENLRYIIPAPKRKRLKRYCDDFEELKRGYADEQDNEALYVEQDYALHGPVKHGRSNTRQSTSLVILPPEEHDPAHVRGEPQPFITNITSVSDQTPLDRRSAKRRIERYSNRAAIENTYTSIKECAAKTTSREIEVRWFHFGFTCIIYNLWLLVDLLTQERIGVIETRKKPRIKLSRFLRWMDRQLVLLI